MSDPTTTASAQDSRRSRSRSRDKKESSCKFSEYPLTLQILVGNDDNVALKLRGFPWQVTDEDVIQFFDGYKLVEGSIKIERGDDDRITGFGAALFETEEEA